MIIDATTVILTLVVVSVAFFGGLRLVRQFALQIAQENHDAVTAMDHAEETKRLKREQAADAAAATAFAKVKPILTSTTTTTTATNPEPSPTSGNAPSVLSVESSSLRSGASV